MLEGLERVDWAHLQHAYGSATDVPGLLRALTIVDRDTRESTVFDLFSNIYHQGTVYEATAPAVPFLIQLLREPAVPAKSDLLDLLAAIALGVVHYYDDHTDWCRRLKITAGEFEARLATERAWVRRAHEAVAAGRAVYAALLRHPGERERMWAAYTLAALREHAGVSSADLRAALQAERSDDAGCCMALSLGALSDGAPADVAALRTLLDTPRDPRRVGGALALVHLAYRQADLSPRAWLEAVAQANPSLAGAFGLSPAPLLTPSDGAGGGALPADAIRVLADVCPRAEALAARFEIYPWFAAACSYSEAAMPEQAPALSETFPPLAEEWFEYAHGYLVGTLNILDWRPPD